MLVSHTALTPRSTRVQEDEILPDLHLRRVWQRLQQLRQLRELSMQATVQKHQALVQQADRQLEQALVAQTRTKQSVQQTRATLQQALQSRSFTRSELAKYSCEVERLQARIIDAASTVSGCRHHSYRANEALVYSRDTLRQLSRARQKIDHLLDTLPENMP